MSKIIIFGNQKGGIGKSSLSVMVANALSQKPHNKKVTVIDTDQQKSLVKLRLMDSEDFEGVLPYPILNYNVSTLEHNIKDLDSRNDYLIIDTGGKLDKNLPTDQQEISRIINYVDVLFVPFVAGNFALESTLDYLKFVIQFRALREKENRPFKIVGLVNMYRERTKNAKFLLSEIDQLKNMVNIPFMQTQLKEYTLFRDTDTLETFYNKNNKSDKAIRNFTKFFDELHTIIK